MIYYDAHAWREVLLRWSGTVISQMWKKWLLLVMFYYGLYVLQVYTGTDLGYTAQHAPLLANGLSFLLVFRANSAYGKYTDSLSTCLQFFSCLREYVQLANILFRGGRGQYVWNRQLGDVGFSLEQKQGLDDEDDHRLSKLRLEFARYCVAIAVSFHLHIRLTSMGGHLFGCVDHDIKSRINWDRMRLRTLLTQLEFDIVDQALRVEHSSGDEHLYAGGAQPHVFHHKGGGHGWYGGYSKQAAAAANPQAEDRTYTVSMEPSYRQILIIISFSLKLVLHHCNQPYGVKERFVPMFFDSSTELMEIHEKAHGSVTVPLPLPYVNLVRMLLVSYLMSVPFLTSSQEGPWANVLMPSLSALALLGIDQIGTEFETVFDMGANAIDVQEMVSSLEMQILRFLEYSGDLVARESFVWLPVPEFIREESSKPFFWYLGLKSQVEHLPIPRCRATSGGTVRVRHVTAPPAGPSAGALAREGGGGVGARLLNA